MVKKRITTSVKTLISGALLGGIWGDKVMKNSVLKVEGLLGVTLTSKEVVLVKIEELLGDQSLLSSDSEKDFSDEDSSFTTKSPGKAKKRKLQSHSAKLETKPQTTTLLSVRKLETPIQTLSTPVQLIENRSSHEADKSLNPDMIEGEDFIIKTEEQDDDGMDDDDDDGMNYGGNDDDDDVDDDNADDNTGAMGGLDESCYDDGEGGENNESSTKDGTGGRRQPRGRYKKRSKIWEHFLYKNDHLWQCKFCEGELEWDEDNQDTFWSHLTSCERAATTGQIPIIKTHQKEVEEKGDPVIGSRRILLYSKLLDSCACVHCGEHLTCYKRGNIGKLWKHVENHQQEEDSQRLDACRIPHYAVESEMNKADVPITLGKIVLEASPNHEEETSMCELRVVNRYICDICGSSYTRNKTLEEHVRTVHEKQFPFNCDQCGKGFSRIIHLTDHLNTHTKNTPYICHTCGKRYRNSTSHKRHEKLCTGEGKTANPTEYNCPHCDKVFREKMRLRDHVKGIHSAPSYQCNYCDQVFSWRSSRVSHMKACHNIQSNQHK